MKTKASVSSENNAALQALTARTREALKGHAPFPQTPKDSNPNHKLTTEKEEDGFPRLCPKH